MQNENNNNNKAMNPKETFILQYQLISNVLYQNKHLDFIFTQMFKTPRHLSSLQVHQLLFNGQIPWSFFSLQ